MNLIPVAADLRVSMDQIGQKDFFTNDSANVVARIGDKIITPCLFGDEFDACLGGCIRATMRRNPKL